jgi:hypothetical protein
LPQTFAGTDELPAGDASLAAAPILAGQLRRLPCRHDPADLAAALAALGAGPPDSSAFTAWWASLAPAPAGRRLSENLTVACRLVSLDPHIYLINHAILRLVPLLHSTTRI